MDMMLYRWGGSVQLAVSLVALRLRTDLLLMQTDKYGTNCRIIALLLQSAFPLLGFWKMNALMANCIFKQKKCIGDLLRRKVGF